MQVKTLDYISLPIKRYGYVKFINDLFKQNKYSTNQEYYDIEEYEYDSDEIISKYNFDKVKATIKMVNKDIYDIYVGPERIGYVVANKRFDEIISKPYKAEVQICSGRGKDATTKQSEFYDYEFELQITSKD